MGRSDGRSEGRSDGGFTLVEVVVSIALVTIVMGALTAYFISVMSLTREQGGRQTAVQLAVDAVERVRKLEPAALVRGRDAQSVDAQWAAPVAGVDLADMARVHDAAAVAGAGATATLPTGYRTVTLDGVDYRQYWYLGQCWQPKGGGTCSTASNYAQMYRLVVAVTWPDRTCTGNRCGYVTSTLISGKHPDPLFNVNGS